MTIKIATYCFCGVLVVWFLINFIIPISLWFIGVALLIYAFLIIRGSVLISSQFFLPAYCHTNEGSGSVAITFDDGPVRGRTEIIIDILKAHQAPATFFCIGKNVKENPDIIRKMRDEGHLVGNHSYFHGPLFDLQSSEGIIRELLNTTHEIKEAIGLKPRFFRPPYGVTNPMVSKAVRFVNNVAIGWSVRSFDTISSNKEKLLRRITRNLKAGDIVLLHDRCDITQQVLPDLLIHIRKAGLKVESLDKLLGENAYEQE